MKAPVLTLSLLGLASPALANKYKDRLKEQQKDKVVPHQAHHRLQANYDSQWCIHQKIDA